MRRGLLFLAALFALALQPPMVSSLGTFPTPLVVGMTGPEGTSAEGPPSMPTETIDIWKWGFTQGGLTIVVLVLFWYITRESARKLKEKADDKAILVGLVERNAVALEKSVETNARIARALEQLRMLPPGGPL